MLSERSRSKRNKCYMTLSVGRLRNEERKTHQWMPPKSGRKEWMGQLGAMAEVCIILSR